MTIIYVAQMLMVACGSRTLRLRCARDKVPAFLSYCSDANPPPLAPGTLRLRGRL